MVFIVLSGLAAAPARREWRLGSVREFARRRAVGFARLFAAVFELPFQRRRARQASSNAVSAAGASAGVPISAIRAPVSAAS